MIVSLVDTYGNVISVSISGPFQRPKVIMWNEKCYIVNKDDHYRYDSIPYMVKESDSPLLVRRQYEAI